jgi:hypothetical protein
MDFSVGGFGENEYLGLLERVLWSLVGVVRVIGSPVLFDKINRIKIVFKFMVIVANVQVITLIKVIIFFV